MTKAKYPDDKRKLVEDALHRFFPAEDRYPEIIYKAMRHSLFSGGKRFRSVLCLLVAETFGAIVDDILPTACGLEYIHTYSLIHDDLPAVDNDDLRRGKPTCHILFGEDMAILAGDALYAEAFYLIASSPIKVEAARILKVIEELAYASGVRGMVSGQVADLQSADKQIKTDVLNFIHERKTGELITSSARAGAIIAGVDDLRLEKVTRFAQQLGLAFQITDDILDVVGETDLLGKEVGSDERHNKATFPSLFGLDEAKRKAKEAIDSAIDALSGMEVGTSSLVELAWFVYQREH
ncbi:MAG: polyprenyl synthetase family protein [Dehalococcoidales bacterium]|nr:polyprenyl synthetase family protein [Dehalococcoidales bacterium]